MSRKPGIGHDALGDVLALVDNPAFNSYLKMKNDVPEGLKHGKTYYPFGRYLHAKLRKLMGFFGSEDVFIDEMVQKNYEACRNGKTLTEHLLDESAERNRQIKARFKIFKKNQRNAI